MSPTVAVCAWIGLVLIANIVHFSADRTTAKSLVVAAAVTAPLLCIAAISSIAGLGVAAALVAISVARNASCARGSQAASSIKRSGLLAE
jgi:hypothetical protein